MRHPHASRRGQGVIEYAFILVIVAIVTIVIILTMGGAIKNVFNNVVCSLTSPPPAPPFNTNPQRLPLPAPPSLPPPYFLK